MIQQQVPVATTQYQTSIPQTTTTTTTTQYTQSFPTTTTTQFTTTPLTQTTNYFPTTTDNQIIQTTTQTQYESRSMQNNFRQKEDYVLLHSTGKSRF